MSSPPLADTLSAWHAIAEAADPFLEALKTESLQSDLLLNGQSVSQSIGSALRRVTYHYWYHIGETQAIRQLFGYRNLPEYVGDIDAEAPYRPE